MEDPTYEVALCLGTVWFIIVYQEEMSNCYSRVKMVVNVLIARGDHVYILRARGSQTSWRCWDVSHSVQGIRLSALESKARRAFQAMQAEYRVNFDLQFWQLLSSLLQETGEQLRGLIKATVGNGWKH